MEPNHSISANLHFSNCEFANFSLVRTISSVAMLCHYMATVGGSVRSCIGYAASPGSDRVAFQ